MAKILIIEDDRYMREVLVEKLKREGYETAGAVDGETGWQMTVNQKPDVIILDLILPVLNGFDYLELKQKKPEVKDIPVIILSNLGQKEDVDRGLKLGAHDYVIKAQFTPNDLIAKVKEVVGA